jgi:glycosyltransferase involved in cell wall biosynthesis
MNPQSPLITIGVTCFNAAGTIRRALDSARSQDWPRKEIIVVDDASTDESLEVIRAHASQVPEIRVIQHPDNRGYPGALNSIVKNARGEYIALFDDDDVSRPDRIAKQFARIRAYEQAHHTRLVLCYANRDVVRGGRSRPDHVAFAIGREPPEPHGPMVADYLFGHLADWKHVWGMFGSCTLMARRDTFLAIGDFDETFRRSAEWDFAVRAALQSAHFIAVNEALITQYKTATADKSGAVPLKYAVQLRHKHRAYLERKNAYLASLAIAHARFHSGKGRGWRSLLYWAAACVLMPPHILLAKVRSRLAGKPTA